jgi:hypothetical protein
MIRIGLLCLALVSTSACSKGNDAPPIEQSYSENFERESLGDDWLATSNAFTLINGALQAKGAHNRPLWLKRALPDNATIELDAWSQSDTGDLKIELYGDGKSYDKDKGAYLSTGYVFVMGGWNNSKSMIARRDEHGVVGKDLVQRTDFKVEVSKRYHWKIVRQGNHIDWFVDDMDTPFLSFDDDAPLTGPGHQHLAIGNWEADNWFDNLTVQSMAQ